MIEERIISKEQIARFGIHLRDEEKCPNTIEKYIRDVNAFVEYANDAEITKEIVIAYKNKLYSENYAVRSINSMLASLDTILHGKTQLLSFKNEDGTLNTLRFLFSKWTLKEGWDNPNVFTIAKLRSSGSENSKLQEVGRGLRLPVDENGNRISNEEFTLNYIVDFTEADFAQKLVDQINGELPQTAIISEEKLNAVAKKIGKSSDDLFDELYDKRYIDRHLNIKPETRDLFFAEYPDFATGLSAGKVKDRNYL